MSTYRSNAHKIGISWTIPINASNKANPSQSDPDRRAPENNQDCLHIMAITVYKAILNLLFINNDAKWL